ncbi:hypothetical protein H0B56_07450 [Haloechinothrix sp. YIM 98757]|uniref:Lipase (Class 3) n=1 Tax=Haloechinothrix aidingensis TaxID=2752311 RepID=A0A837ZYT4_9PSEU|nr:hypothetical protein [Haloechinothrix aidingensis]
MALPGQDTRVVELRVPGLVGLSGERLLDTVSAVTVAGDETAQVIRPSDRLHRPAPGPVLQALRRSMPRTLEGYLWHKMTSGGPVKAVWALLFPFALANVAHGMLPPVVPSSSLSRACAAALRAILRAVGILLTALFVTQLGVISLDLVAATCLGEATPAQTGCLGGTPAFLSAELVRVAIGLTPLLALVAVLHTVSGMRWLPPGEVGSVHPDQPDAGNGELPGHALAAGRNVRVLRALHTLTALSCIALLPLGGVSDAPDGATRVVVWACALGLLGASLVTAAVLDDTARWPRALLPPTVVVILLVVAVALVVAAGAYHLPLDSGGAAGVTGINTMVEAIGAALLLGCVAFGVLLVPSAILARRLWRALPRRLRPWLGGWVAAPTLFLACLTGAGFGAGLAIAVRELLGERGFALPTSYTALTLLWGAGTVGALLIATITYGIAIPLRKRSRGIPMIVRMLHSDERDRESAADAWAASIIERKHLHRLVSALVILMAAGALALVAMRMTGTERPGWLEPLSALGVFALGLLAAGLLRVVYTAARSQGRDRHLGALADLVYFWPRSAHPVVPPSYALKVVPDVADRVRHHLADASTHVVVSGYSHGGLLAVLAVARLAGSVDEAQRERIGLVTAGSPLQWGYQRAFPALLPHTSLATLYGTLHGRWRGLCRGTDPFGGGVTTWRHQIVDDRLLGVGYLTDGGIGPLPAAEQSPNGALVLGGDHWLPDPVPHSDNGHRWAAGTLRHSDYLIDQEWDRAVAIAAGLERPGGARGSCTEQAALFSDLPAFGKPPGARRSP